MRHSGNYTRVITESYGGEGVTMKLYVYDELDRFLTVTELSLGKKTIEHLLNGIIARRAALDDETQMELFD